FKFCLVRNPYTRLLSAYLDKIAQQKPQIHSIKIGLGRAEDDPRAVSFSEFIDTVIQQAVPEMDHHWRRQYEHTYQATIDYDFIGRFEQFEQDFLHILDRLQIDKRQYYQPEQRHATNASALLQEYYTEALAEKVYQKYQIDFEYFGYPRALPKT
ncbi:MAG: sulfotransferase family protein, partial [Bacteroidota bacterium]